MPLEPTEKLSITIKNKHPVELVDYTRSLFSVGDEYNRFIDEDHGVSNSRELKLYINQLRNGSLVADMIAATGPGFLPLIGDYTKALVEFFALLKNATQYLKGENQTPPKSASSKRSLQNIKSFYEVTAKDSGSVIVCENYVNSMVVNKFEVTSLEANAIQNTATRIIDQIKTPLAGAHEKVLMYWHQARNEPDSSSGDKAIIESISHCPAKVVFVNDAAKSEMLTGVENIFNKAYLVDVIAETLQGKPIFYKIQRVIQVINRE